MLDVNTLKYGDILVMTSDCFSVSSGNEYNAGTEVKVVKVKHKHDPKSTTDFKTTIEEVIVKYPDGVEGVAIGEEAIAELVGKPFKKKTKEDVDLEIGDVFMIDGALLIKEGGCMFEISASEVKLTGLSGNGLNYLAIDINGLQHPHSCSVEVFLYSIALKNIKLLKEVKRINIYSDRKELKVGDIIVTTGEQGDVPFPVKAGVYGKVTELYPLTQGFVCCFEKPISEDFKTLTQHTVHNKTLENGVFKIVDHRNVPKNFETHTNIEVECFIPTKDRIGVVGKKYWVVADETNVTDKHYIEVICTQEREASIVVNAKTFKLIGNIHTHFLYEKTIKTKMVALEPTATVNLN